VHRARGQRSARWSHRSHPRPTSRCAASSASCFAPISSARHAPSRQWREFPNRWLKTTRPDGRSCSIGFGWFASRFDRTGTPINRYSSIGAGAPRRKKETEPGIDLGLRPENALGKFAFLQGHRGLLNRDSKSVCLPLVRDRSAARRLQATSFAPTTLDRVPNPDL
jgi:hypothetical protein